MRLTSIWKASLLVSALMAGACQGEVEESPSEAARPLSRVAQASINPGKALILSTSVQEGLSSREAVAAANLDLEVQVVTAAEWSAMTAADFRQYQALIIGDTACQDGDLGPAQAASGNRDVWGAVVNGNVLITAADPATNKTPELIENAVAFAAARVGATGMYLSLACAYQSAEPGTPVALLKPFGDFSVAGVGCYPDAHIFEMSPQQPSLNLYMNDPLLTGAECAARAVFTHYPDRTFAPVAIAVDPLGKLPGSQPYLDAGGNMGQGATFIGTPYIIARGAMAVSTGCGGFAQVPQECDLGVSGNGVPAQPGTAAEETCSFSCKHHWCGDGVVDTSEGEECDEGSNNGRLSDDPGACTSFCKHVQPPPSLLSSPPVAQCKDLNLVADLTCGASGSIDDGSSDPDGDLVGCTQSPAGPYLLGATTVTLTCTDQQNQTSSCSATVTVADTTPPDVQLQGPEEVVVECAQAPNEVPYEDPGIIATDACEGDLSGVVLQSGDPVYSMPGVYSRMYEVTDAAGNSGSAFRTIVVLDTQAPEVTLMGPEFLRWPRGMPYIDPGAIAQDLCEGYLPVEYSGSVNTAVVGTYTLHYQAYDFSGNVSKPVTRTVLVMP